MLESSFSLFFTQKGISTNGVLLYEHVQDGFRLPVLAPGAVAPETYLAPPPGCGDSLSADAISADGNAVVGRSACGVHRWTAANGMQLLTAVATAEPSAISDDGSVVAGLVTSPARTPWIWTNESGFQLLPITLRSGTRPVLSGDGTTIAASAVTANGNEAVVWDAGGGVTPIGDVPGGAFSSSAVDLSADGSTVVGTGTGDGGALYPFAWTSASGLVALPAPGVARAATPSGLALGHLIGDPTGDDVFVWNPASGWWQSLESLLRAAMVPVASDGLQTAIGISDDGRTIAGNRSIPDANAEIWLATIDLPACSNGVDDDGDLLADFPADPGCRNGRSGREDPQCDNGIDDDGDLAIDHPDDTLCQGAWDNDEARNAPSCGIGAELLLAAGLLASIARRGRGRAQAPA